MKTTHLIILAVTTEVDVPGLKDLIADRAWRIDGVCHTDAQVMKSFPTGVQVDDETITSTIMIDDGGNLTHVMGDLPPSAYDTDPEKNETATS